MNEYVKCFICNFSGRDIRTHLRQKHKVPVAEYLIKYPNAEIISELTLYRRREQNKISQNRPEIKEAKKQGMIQAHKNKKWASYGMLGKAAWNKGLTKEDSRVKNNIEKMKKTMRERYWSKKTYAVMYGEEKANAIIQKQSAAAIELMKDPLERKKRSDNNWMKRQTGKTVEEIYGSEQGFILRQKASENAKKQCMTKISLGQKQVRDFLIEKGYEVIFNKSFCIGVPDIRIIINNEVRIIEYNGCYWHNHEHMNIDLNINLEIARNVQGFSTKCQKYTEQNYKYLIVWECEWQNNRAEHEQKILEFLKNP